MGSSGEEKLARPNDTCMSKNKKRILLWALFLFGIALLFLPVRVDHVSQIISGGPDALTYTDAVQDYYCSVFIGFNGHPVGIALILLFALGPFGIVAQSFSVTRPFGFTATALLRLQALLMFIGGPYLWYMITYQHGYFSNTIHETEPAWGGWLLIGYCVLSGILLYWILVAPKSRIAEIFEERR
jgi:hypothetical protein